MGAPFEGGWLERLVWRVIGRTGHGEICWTDDTQMALDLVQAVLSSGGIDQAAIAAQFARSYRWSRGYGRGTAKILKQIHRGVSWRDAVRAVYPDGSFGNGAAMRSAVMALFFPQDRQHLIAATTATAQITHAHLAGIAGAVAIAVAAQALLQHTCSQEVFELVISACNSSELTDKLRQGQVWLERADNPSAHEVAVKLGNGMTAVTSCPTAIYVALRYRNLSFEQMMDFVIRCGGDTDSIGAMAGSLWGIANGPERLPSVKLEQYQEILELAGKIKHFFCDKQATE